MPNERLNNLLLAGILVIVVIALFAGWNLDL